MRATRRSIGSCLVAALIATGLTACGSSDDPDTTQATSSTAAAATEQAADAKPLAGKKIAYIQTGGIDYYRYSREGAEMAVGRLGGEAKIYQSDFDPQKELANVQNAITQKVDGLVLFPISAASEKSELRLLKKAGIPVVVLYGYDKSIADMAASFVQVDFISFIKPMGDWVRENVPQGDVAIINGQAGRPDDDGYAEGFMQGLQDRKRVVQQVNADYDRQKAFNVTKDLMTSHPGIKAIFAGNEDMAAGAVQALGTDKAKSDVAVVSENGSPLGIKMLKLGTLRATSGNSPSFEAGMAISQLSKAIAGEPTATLCQPPTTVSIGTDINATPWEPTPELMDEALALECKDAS